MDYRDALTHMLNGGMDMLWRTAKAMPEDKLDWQPAPTARTARELLNEIVMTTMFSTEFLHNPKPPEMGEGQGGMETTKGVDELEQEHRQAMAEFIAAMKEFPDDRLMESFEMPWGKTTFLDAMAYCYWNMMYHLGQISYIQTMYGDKEMH